MENNPCEMLGRLCFRISHFCPRDAICQCAIKFNKHEEANCDGSILAMMRKELEFVYLVSRLTFGSRAREQVGTHWHIFAASLLMRCSRVVLTQAYSQINFIPSVSLLSLTPGSGKKRYPGYEIAQRLHHHANEISPQILITLVLF